MTAAKIHYAGSAELTSHQIYYWWGGCLIFFIYKKCVRQYANNTFSRLVIQFEFDLISAHFQLA